MTSGDTSGDETRRVSLGRAAASSAATGRSHAQRHPGGLARAMVPVVSGGAPCFQAVAPARTSLRYISSCLPRSPPGPAGGALPGTPGSRVTWSLNRRRRGSGCSRLGHTTGVGDGPPTPAGGFAVTMRAQAGYRTGWWLQPGLPNAEGRAGHCSGRHPRLRHFMPGGNWRRDDRCCPRYGKDPLQGPERQASA